MIVLNEDDFEEASFDKAIIRTVIVKEAKRRRALPLPEATYVHTCTILLKRPQTLDVMPAAMDQFTCKSRLGTHDNDHISKKNNTTNNVYLEETKSPRRA
ncbi:hypothetical protein FHL15_009081 [Xylaria flabelliformis]|uniref:Uncharacterized protein n=1 Tax=Xylaria flabelliformis TaxID=2512241 RepID=A0A553HPX4_9PEZI|nr:hypothetical protein FHL15_009081 [Xylaria flabelliformis]